MSANDRIFYACQAVAISDMANDTLTLNEIVRGAQSIGMTTNFNLEQAFELGQIDIYENIEGVPDLEVTMEKVLDGYPLIYHMATTGIEITESGLVGRSKQRADVRLGIYSDGLNNVVQAQGANQNNGNAEVEVYCSGMYMSSISYSFQTDGSATESVTLVGNNKQWLTGNDVKILDSTVGSISTGLNGNDSPLAIGSDANPSGGIVQREDFLLEACIMPRLIEGVYDAAGTNATHPNGSGYGNAWDHENNSPTIHVQSVSVSTDFGREDILELGAKTPYARPANFPIEVTCEIEAITVSGDFVSAYEYGDEELYTTVDSGNNTRNEAIFFYTRAGYGFDLGDKNRLQSVTYGGGDAGGGNASCTYSFSNFNVLDVQDQRIHTDATHGSYVGHKYLQKGNADVGGGTFPSKFKIN